ncbi:unnamed protein product, partial [marine sediment metagenome]
DGYSQERKQVILKKAKKDFEEMLGTAFTDNEFNTLNKYKFSFDICNNIVKLIYYAYNESLISQTAFSKREKDRGIIIRDVKTQNEEERKDLSSIVNIEKAGTLLSSQSRVVLNNEKAEIRKVAVSLTKSLFQPNLTFNKNATEKRKQIVLDNVKPVYSKVQENEIIIREGEKITPANLDKLETFLKAQKGEKFLSFSIFLGIFLTTMILSITSYYLSRNWLKNLIQDVNGDIDISRQKDDLRFMISKRILEIYASRHTVATGNQSEIPL